MSEETEAWVYVIGPAAGSAVKVGVAGDVGKRLASLQTGHPAPLLVHFKLGSTRDEAFAIENCAHLFMDGLGTQGEWFDVMPQVAEGFVRAAAVAVRAGRHPKRARVLKVKAERVAKPQPIGVHQDGLTALWVGGFLTEAQYRVARAYRGVYEVAVTKAPPTGASPWRSGTDAAEAIIDCKEWVRKLHMAIADGICMAAADQLRLVAGERRELQSRGGSRDRHLLWLTQALDVALQAPPAPTPKW